MKDIEIKLKNKSISPHNEIRGIVIVNYQGLYDGVVINTQIIDSNELVVWRSYNGKKITQNVSRLFISKNAMLENKTISPHNEIKGTVVVNYQGLYDGVVINTQIIGSNELVVWHSYNGKKISQNVSRLFISKDVMPENNAEFTAAIEFEPKESHDFKFPASIIEQHKDVESDQLFAVFSA